jgi:predicted nucleotidyltransferase
VLFGSHSRGDAGRWSDINLVVIAPEFDGDVERRTVSKQWEARAFTDSRIELVPCGEREWETDDSRPILEIGWCLGSAQLPPNLKPEGLRCR